MARPPGQDGRVDGRAPDAAFDGFDARVQALKVERLHEGPDSTGLVVGGQAGIQVTDTQLDLIAYGALHARCTRGGAALEDSRAICGNTQALK